MTKKLFYVVIIAAVTLLSLGLRMVAAARLNVDYDEPVYLGAALDYTNAIRSGQFKMLAWNDNTYEHPALYKILYGFALLTQKPLEKYHLSDLPRLDPIAATEARDWNMAGRYLSVAFGTLAVFVLALFNPLAGLFLGLNSLSVKYTSEVYLEALPLLASLLSALTYRQWFKNIKSETTNSSRHLLWLLLSAAFLGATAASKYVYCVVGVAILVHFLIALIQKQVSRRALIQFIGWGFLSILMFFLLNPYLWPHPWSRLLGTITFHIGFQNSNIVKLYHYPLWQSFLWLFSLSSFYDLGPKSAFLVNIDKTIFILALLGLPRLFQKEKFFFIWLVVGLAFLLVWTTKWPQYTLIILVPFVLASAQGCAAIWDLARKYLFYQNPAGND